MNITFNNREEYLDFRKNLVNTCDELYHLNELEKMGIRVGSKVYVRINYKAYSCEVMGFTKKRCEVIILDEGKLQGVSKKVKFDRIHINASEINLR